MQLQTLNISDLPLTHSFLWRKDTIVSRIRALGWYPADIVNHLVLARNHGEFTYRWDYFRNWALVNSTIVIEIGNEQMPYIFQGFLAAQNDPIARRHNG